MPFILETKALTKKFGGLIAVDQVNLRLDEGELRCIIGPNGCGKTTLFNLISGFYKPSEGQVLYNGQDITGKAVYTISQLGIGRKFQVPSVFNQLTVYENIRVPFYFRYRHSRSAGADTERSADQEMMGLLAKVTSATGTGIWPSIWPTERSSGSRSEWSWQANPGSCFSMNPRPG